MPFKPLGQEEWQDTSEEEDFDDEDIEGSEDDTDTEEKEEDFGQPFKKFFSAAAKRKEILHPSQEPLDHVQTAGQSSVSVQHNKEQETTKLQAESSELKNSGSTDGSKEVKSEESQTKQATSSDSLSPAGLPQPELRHSQPWQRQSLRKFRGIFGRTR